MNRSSLKPTLAITLGDPLGIGSEIVTKALSDPQIKKLAEWKIFGLKKVPERLTARLAGELAWEALEDAIDCFKAGLCDGLVTAPVSKTHLRLAGFKFPGQTEYLADQFSTSSIRMMLASPELKVVLVTIHVPLKKIFPLLTVERIAETITMTHDALKKDFGLKKPRLAVCGLNPHAGEGGLMGREELEIIEPAIRKAARKRIEVSGPYPSDTVFYQARKGKFDAVICHYHDQGLIPLKTLSFDEGVNTTLGLPIIRTSPDHGCAFDIAGKGIANPASMKMAMRMAVAMGKMRKRKS